MQAGGIGEVKRIRLGNSKPETLFGLKDLRIFESWGSGSPLHQTTRWFSHATQLLKKFTRWTSISRNVGESRTTQLRCFRTSPNALVPQ